MGKEWLSNDRSHLEGFLSLSAGISEELEVFPLQSYSSRSLEVFTAICSE